MQNKNKHGVDAQSTLTMPLFRAPSAMPAAARLRQRACRNRKRQQKKRTRRQQGAGGHAEHRLCPRCERRSDVCRKSGCVPYEFRARAAPLAQFFAHLQLTPVRFSTDCVDMQCAALAILALQGACGTRIALLGACVYCHFNSLRSFAVLLRALQGPAFRWASFLRRMRRCQTLWGGRTGLGLYSGMNMSGSGFPRLPGVDRLGSICAGFQRLYKCLEFRRVVERIDAGVHTLGDFHALRLATCALAKANPGALGTYHLKLLFDTFVATKWAPTR